MKLIGKLLGYLVLILSGTALLFWLSQVVNKQASSPPHAPAPDAVPMEDLLPPVEPPKPPKHYYLVEDNGEYGYEPALSKEDQDAGRVTSEMITVRYLGFRNNRYQVAQIANEYYSLIYDCEAPCEIIRMRQLAGARVTNKKFMRATDGALITAIFTDARNGELKPYKFKSTGKYRFIGDDNQLHQYDSPN